jgi:hypothetical protein
MELSYDYGFTSGGTSNSQYNGNISGIKWRSMGDGAYRSYGFTYDPSNRLLRADFTQRVGSSDWRKDIATNLNINFSMYIGDGLNPRTTYDANGNILSMNQYGLQQQSSPLIDQLSYGYQQISVNGKGTISYTYDAQGGKRSKTVTESVATVTYKGQTFYNVSITTTTYNINSWVYESKTYSNSTLQNALGIVQRRCSVGMKMGGYDWWTAAAIHCNHLRRIILSRII